MAPTTRWRIVAFIALGLALVGLIDLFAGGPVVRYAAASSSSELSLDDLRDRLPSLSSLDALWDQYWTGGADGDPDEVLTAQQLQDALQGGDGDGEGPLDVAIEDEAASAPMSTPASTPTPATTPSFNETCSPEAFDGGRWVERPKPHMAPRCRWHVELREAPRPLARARSFDWQPRSDCTLLVSSPLERINHLIDEGGMMLVGDSTVRGHFFELACAFSSYFEMADIYGTRMSSSAPLLRRAKLVVPRWVKPRTLGRSSWPRGFKPGQTPLVSYVRHDFLLSREEMIAHLPTVGLGAAAAFLVGRRGEKDNHVDPSAVATKIGYLTQFADGRNRYASLVSTTGLHWRTIWSDNGHDASLAVLRAVVDRWAEIIARDGPAHQRVYLRASAPYERACRNGATSPSITIDPPLAMHWVLPFNQEMQAAAQSHPHLRWLGLERLSRLRADAHAFEDCLHFPVGAQVVEAWSDLLFHQIMSEPASPSPALSSSSSS